MNATAVQSPPTKPSVLGRYEAGGEARVLVGRRIEGEVYVYDYPDGIPGRPYFVEAGFESKAELAILIADYRSQAERFGTCPMSRSAIAASFASGSPAVNRATEPGRLTRATVHNDAGEVEVRLSAAGNWQVTLRAAGDREWSLACSGDLGAGAVSLAPPREPEITRFGALELDVEGRSATVAGRAVNLSVLEFDLLTALAEEPHRVFTKQQLLKSVWGYESNLHTRTLDSHASKLRVALRKAGAEGYVINIKGVGYKLWRR